MARPQVPSGKAYDLLVALYQRWEEKAVEWGLQHAATRHVRIEQSYGDYNDIIAAAKKGLWEAVIRIDPYRELNNPGSFERYAKRWVKGAVNREIERITNNPRRKSGGKLRQDYEVKYPLEENGDGDGTEVRWEDVEFMMFLEEKGLHHAGELVAGGMSIEEAAEILGMEPEELYIQLERALREWYHD
ncbi:MAG: hypothetical protein QXI19_03430 [Candidatus Caldarchaeum sp.]